VASGRFWGGGDLSFENRDCYAALTHVGYGPYGVLR
jgi:hypothetical protein